MNETTTPHAPMAYETFVLMKAALENELAEKGRLQDELAAMTQEIAEIKADAERFRRLARECYLPDDHPENSVAVIVPESIVPLGGFTLDPDNDLKSLRIAVDNMP